MCQEPQVEICQEPPIKEEEHAFSIASIIQVVLEHAQKFSEFGT